jgi:hypothetical protein
MIVEVTLLDGTLAKFDLDSKCSGQDLLDRVAEHLNLVKDHRYLPKNWMAHALVYVNMESPVR